jgi:hypothetical protein
VQHGAVGRGRGSGRVARFKLELRFEGFPFRCRQREVHGPDYLARAFADAHVAGGVLARVGPIGVERGIYVVHGHGRQIVDHFLALRFADALDKRFEALPIPALRQIRPAIRSTTSECA